MGLVQNKLVSRCFQSLPQTLKKRGSVLVGSLQSPIRDLSELGQNPEPCYNGHCEKKQLICFGFFFYSPGILPSSVPAAAPAPSAASSSKSLLSDYEQYYFPPEN